MVGEPCKNVRIFVGRIIVGDGVNALSRRDGSLDGVQKSNEFLMAMLFHAAADESSIVDIECDEKRGHAVAFVIEHLLARVNPMRASVH